MYLIGGVGDARGCIASFGLGEDIGRREGGELCLNEVGKPLSRDHKEVICGDDGGEALAGLLDHRSARAEDVEELLGLVVPAHGPEA